MLTNGPLACQIRSKATLSKLVQALKREETGVREEILSTQAGRHVRLPDDLGVACGIEMVTPAPRIVGGTEVMIADGPRSKGTPIARPCQPKTKIDVLVIALKSFIETTKFLDDVTAIKSRRTTG